MCGICGFVDPRGLAPDAARTVEAMALSLASRGPDGQGTWIDPEAGVALGHRRLAIIDLSAAGAQPLASADGRVVVTFNGEIYNHRELRGELEDAGRRFRGQSDTEVLAEALAAWGVAAALRRLVGIFAFASWDRRERRLTLARDHLGVKPLHWSLKNGRLCFASELKSLRAHPGFEAEVDREALAAYLRHGYVPGPRTAYAGVSKLPPGCLLEWVPGTEPRMERYWDLRGVAAAGTRDPLRLDDREATDALEALLRDSVRGQMVSDVPLGAFLSGGIDSSAVVALMQAASPRPVRTFTVGFLEDGHDEAAHARRVAEHLGTEHADLYLDARAALDVVPSLADHYDEPFGDPSQIPTVLLSRMARGHVTVALSGDGGDELFAGYDRYRQATEAWGRIGAIPAPIRRAAARLIEAAPAGALDRAVRGFAPLRDAVGNVDRLRKSAALLGAPDADALYRALVSHCPAPEELIPGAREARGALWDEGMAEDLPSFLDRMQCLDALTYLPDDVLTKVDRASMAVGLEVRVPLLDHRVAEFAWRLPASLRMRDGKAKWILRQVLDRHVPRGLVERPKMGFGVPIGEWLRGPLRDWAESLLDERRLREDGILDPVAVRRLWAEHLGGDRDWQYRLWDVLMLVQWRDRWRSPTAGAQARAMPAA